MKKLIKKLHNKLIYSRRTKRLTELITPLLNKSQNILDVGCGDGIIDYYLLSKNNKIKIDGIDVLIRPNSYIKVKRYNGKSIPFSNKSYDTVIAIDVLHHVENFNTVLSEMVRVSSKYIIIKDHIKTGFFSALKLKMMDYVGNSYKKINLPYNYHTMEEWNNIFHRYSLKIVKMQTKLNLYTGIFHLLFDRKLHFIAVLEKKLN